MSNSRRHSSEPAEDTGGRAFTDSVLSALRGAHDGEEDLAGLAHAVGADAVSVYRLIGNGRTRRFVLERCWPVPAEGGGLDPARTAGVLERLETTGGGVELGVEDSGVPLGSAFSIVCEQEVVGFLAVGGRSFKRGSKKEGLCRLMAGVLGLLEAQRRADDAVRSTRERFRRVIDSIPQLIFWKDRASRYRGCNRNFAHEVGLESPDDIVGLTDAEVRWETEEMSAARRGDREVMVDDEPRLHQVESHARADGSTRSLDANLIPLHGRDGEVVGMLGAFEDVTARRELEMQLRHAQKMEAVGRLAGGIAHDFNNLMTAILGHAEVAAEKLPDGSAGRKNLEEIVWAVSKTQNLTRQLLAFARRQVTEPRVVDVNRLIVDTERLFRRLVREDVVLTVSTGADLGRVRIDPGQLEQVLVNLVINAADAMPDGGELTIVTDDFEQPGPSAAESGLAPGRYTTVSVRDTGTGMSEDVVTRIFEPFFTTKPQDRGTGLGLPTAYGIVQQAGGEIQVATARGAGSTFTVYLPWSPGDASASDPPPEPKAGQGSGETVLLVEDQDNLRSLYAEIIQNMGYRVLVAANGEEALALVHSRGVRVDVLVTDLVMPVMGGARLSEIMGRESPQTRIIIITGYAGADGLETSSLPRTASILPKPFSVAQLGERIAAALARGGHGDVMAAAD